MTMLSIVFEDLGGSNASEYGVVMPLTTGIKVEAPEDVVGFAWCTVADRDVKFVTLPKRDWEVSAAYTGLDADIYGRSLVDDVRRDERFSMLIGSPMFTSSNHILRKSLELLDVWNEVVETQRALATAASPRKRMIPDNVDTVHGLVKWLNDGTPLRKMNRKQLVEHYGLFFDDRTGVPVAGRNLAMDSALVEFLLKQDVEFEEKDDDLK